MHNEVGRQVIPLLLAGAVSGALSLMGTQHLIGWLRTHRVGQPIHEDVPDGHIAKAGTPTMGGAAIVVAAAVGYLVAHLGFVYVFDGDLVFTRTGLLVLLVIAAAGTVGALDDWIKVTYERNLGLSKMAKSGGLLAVAVTFAVGMVQFTNVHETLSFTRFDQPGWDLGPVLWCVWAVLLILGCTNAVNLTDGLDGLAAGSAIYGFLAMTVIGFWAWRHTNLGEPPGTLGNIYDIAHALDLAIVAAAMAGAVTGFLWWNAPPAQIFMGDTGSLAIGAGLAALSLALNTQLLLPLVGALYVFETLSVIIQVGSFRVFHRRVFRMAPIHHHFELGGWPETTVIIRFWILALMSTAVALGIFYADFVSTGAAD